MESFTYHFLNTVGKFFQSFLSSAPHADLPYRVKLTIYVPKDHSFTGRSISLATFMKEKWPMTWTLLMVPLTDKDYLDLDLNIEASDSKSDKEAIRHLSRGKVKS